MLSTSILPKSAEPVLKWAGGKRRLVEQYAKHFQLSFGDYYEPFIGGGAIYFWLWTQGRLAGKQCRLTDINPELVNFYSVLKSDLPALSTALAEHQEKHDSTHYYRARSQDPLALDPVKRAARLLYLNRTCFNGLYRENSKGQFNVPMGHYKAPRILHPEGLSSAAAALAAAKVEVASYLEVEDHAKGGDLVYFDPPYQPMTPTSSFTSYTQHNFSETDQAMLAALFRRLSKKGVRVLLSNSDTPLIREIYGGFQQHQVQAARAINSKADGRQKITELLIVG